MVKIPGLRRLARVLVPFIAVVGAVSAAVVPASANTNYLGLLSSGPPESPPFVFSPNYQTIGPSGALITFTISVTNKTTTPQTLTLNFNVHRILTYYGLWVGDGQPGQPGITFVKGDAPNLTQQLVAPNQYMTVTFPPKGSAPTVLTFTQVVTKCAYYQVDVGQHKGLNQVAANLSVGFTRVLGCESGQRFTPGFWKNHQAATEAQLPQQLGGYTVATFADAQAIFNAMKCSAPANCLAGHLLAAQLDMVSGSSSCIAPTVLDANNFLSSIGYHGVDSYTLTPAQASQALAFEVALDAYTNDSTSDTC